MSWVEEDIFQGHIKAILYCWQGGQIGGLAVADILSGAVSPSGKLTDTIARKMEDYPSDRNFGDRKQNIYQEDIYVGYRYFETFCPEKVLYPFGFGLSYTKFSIRNAKGKLTENHGEKSIQILAEVSNIGEYSRKETVQVYVSAPQGLLGKPALELKAFVKTSLLAPGESETVTLSIPVRGLASYDDSGITGRKSAYVLEAGEYRFYAGNSIRQLQPVCIGEEQVWNVPALVVMEQLEEALAPILSFERMKPSEKKRTEPGNLRMNLLLCAR